MNEINNGSQGIVPESAAAATSGHLIETQISRPTESETVFLHAQVKNHTFSPSLLLNIIQLIQ